ncbi:lysine N(6)-hydroxylase/L-ornithine N(5)-oxygenase family protein [Rhodococcus opacus]|uniref:L-lysine N6-monooxygenase MbtG n=1 Tax=Rhodococcus opacus (strain B4) TaxID=632772 RepID=C1B2F5_RHOOB|nr:SidA/IucD/PvdA family monooxygenase [Rhodococcus opacus]BAH50579.1 L-ornithine N5-oxygenase [Rhodococcus opacus B4]
MTGQSRGIPGDPVVLDIVGVGFGPSNLSLAIAVAEHNSACPPGERIGALFFESQDRFSWHPGMLLDGATMQVAFPKDLVTLRNPTSRYTFLNYLFVRGRLVDFVNHQTFFPSRYEFQDYLRWAAEQVDADVRYESSVQRVRPLFDDRGVADQFLVETADGTQVRTRNVVLGTGLAPRIPDWVTPSARCFHNKDFLTRMAELPEPVHGRFVVLGAGQSAAEVVQYLHATYRDAEIHSVFARFGYSPADDSPYANRIFDPGTVDELHRAPPQERDRLLRLHRGTNYSAVDSELIDALYATEYQERVRGERRLFMRRASTIADTVETDRGLEVSIRNLLDGSVETLTCDAVVLATGYTPAPLRPLFGDFLPSTESSREVSRDYRLRTDPCLRAGIYLQGGTETTHGITSSLLSNVAVRAGEVLHSVLAHRATPT